MTHSHWLESTRGYIALGMLDEAWKTLDSIPEDQRDHPDFLEQRIVIMLNRENLESALELCKEMMRRFPEKHAGFIQGAYCLHEMGQTKGAQECLQSGPSTMREEPLYFYNLGCYDFSLGKQDAAVAWLKRSFEMNPRLRMQALEDPDLKDIHDQIEAEL